ncbi:MAG: pyridoxamine 5'-phosphate oxidase family protein [Cellulosilyticaceae bacterium]
MRRGDLEITDQEALREIINRCDVCRIGLYDGRMPYIVPMNFGYTYEQGELIFYLHGAKKGRKMTLLEENPHVCFEMDIPIKILEGPRPCDYGMLYKSIMGEGTVTFIEDYQQKVDALIHIMKKYAPDKNFSFTPARVDPLAVMQLRVCTLTGKASKPKPFQIIS